LVSGAATWHALSKESVHPEAEDGLAHWRIAMSNPRRSSLRVALASAALGAGLVFAVAPARTEAGPGLRKHAAKSADIDFDTALTREPDSARWTIGVSAANASAARHCNVRVSLTRMPESARFSRVVRSPTPVWSTFVAMEIPAKAEAKRSVAVPANIAREIEAARKDERTERASLYGTSASADCAPSSDSVG
jgi:hypothetical protein